MDPSSLRADHDPTPVGSEHDPLSPLVELLPLSDLVPTKYCTESGPNPPQSPLLLTSLHKRGIERLLRGLHQIHDSHTERKWIRRPSLAQGKVTTVRTKHETRP